MSDLFDLSCSSSILLPSAAPQLKREHIFYILQNSEIIDPKLISPLGSELPGMHSSLLTWSYIENLDFHTEKVLLVSYTYWVVSGIYFRLLRTC
jgi:hypothetical protein